MSSGHCFFIVLVMISCPENETVFISGYLCTFSRAKTFFPNLKLSTEHQNLFSGFREMSCDSFLPQTGLWREKKTHNKNNSKFFQSMKLFTFFYQSWKQLYWSNDSRFENWVSEIGKNSQSETRRIPPLQSRQ